MIALIRFVLAILGSPFKSKSRLEAENAALRQQLIVLRRRMKGRARFTNADRWFFVQLYRWFPSILEVLTIIRPETLVGWHRAGFRRYWRWKSGEQGGRPQIQAELRALIRQMSVENPLWGAPRIHGELLKLGFEVSTARTSIGLPLPSDAPAIRMFRMVIAEARSLIRQRNEIERMADDLLGESADYQALRRIPKSVRSSR